MAPPEDPATRGKPTRGSFRPGCIAGGGWEGRGAGAGAVLAYEVRVFVKAGRFEALHNTEIPDEEPAPGEI